MMNSIFKKITVIAIFLTFFVGISIDQNQNLDASNNFEITEDYSGVSDRLFMDGTIVFDSNMNGNWDIYAMDGQGRNLRQLTFSASDQRWPSLSPDGSHIAYSSNEEGSYNIVIQDIQGGDRRFNLTHNGTDDIMPDWGPWDQIIYVSNLNGNKDIFLKNIWGTPEEQGFGQSDAVQMTFSPQDEVEPAFAGEAYGNIFAYEINGDIWGLNMDDFRNWVIREGGQDERSPEFHPFDAVYPEGQMQPQFIYLNNDNLYWSNIGWSNNYKNGQMQAARVPGVIKHVSFSSDDPCTIAFSLKEGGKIGLFSYCDPSMNPILLPDGNTNYGASKIDYGRNASRGGMMGGMMGGMRDMGNSMMDGMQRQEDMMREEMERQAELDRERNEMMRQQMEEQERMDRERIEQQMELDEERMRMDRERMEQQMEQDRERMEMERQMMEEQEEFERERMEQQREMMGRMEGSGGRDDFFEPDERCFVEDAEEGRGLFGNLEIGSEVDCELSDGLRERFEDPTSLAMLGLVVTVGATMLQMLRGN